jgi:hypothetical protein
VYLASVHRHPHGRWIAAVLVEQLVETLRVPLVALAASDWWPTISSGWPTGVGPAR